MTFKKSLKKLRPYFLKQFQIHSKINGEIEISHIFSPLLPSLLIPNIPHQSGTFVTIDEPVSPTMAYFQCCIVYEFGQTYNNMHLSLWCHTEYFQNSKIPLCFPCLSLPPPQPLTGTIFSCFCSFLFPLSRILYSWQRTICNLFRFVSFTQ